MLGNLKFRRAEGVVLLVSAALLMSGCARNFLVSSPVPPVDSSGVSRGVIYHLPMRVVALTATRKGVSATALDAILAQIKTELDAATALANSAKAAADREKALLDALPAAASEAARTSQRVSYEVALANQSLAEAARARVAARFAGTTRLQEAARARGQSLVCDYSVKIDQLPLVADTASRYVAEISHSVWREDQVELKVGTNGLLSNSLGQANNQSLEIIETIAGAVAAITSPASGVRAYTVNPSVAGTQLRPTPCREGEQTVTGIFDFSDGSLERNNLLLQQADIPFEIGIELIRSSSSRTVGGPQPPKTIDGPVSQQHGLLYRVDVPVRVTVSRQYLRDPERPPPNSAAPPSNAAAPEPVPSLQPVPIQSLVVSVPQFGPVGLIPFRSGFGVTTLTEAVFTDGILTSWSETRPSEMLAVANAPLAVASAIVRVPTELVRLRVDYSSANRNLANAEIAEAAALANRASLRRCLIAAAGDPTAVDACLDE